jgi:type II secretory pathway pseudopilin PulG
MRRAFTLIELLIAIGLGMLLIYTAVAGFRVATQCATISNRLSLENALIRAGINEAHQQLDFWTNLDDPDDSSRRRLRGTVALTGDRWSTPYRNLPGASAVGFPFTPLRTGFPVNREIRTSGNVAANSQVPRAPAAPGFRRAEISAPPAPVPETLEYDTGFDPTYTWAPHDPRTWFRANCLEKYRDRNPGWMPPTIMGRYGIFTGIDENPTLLEFTGVQANATDTNQYRAAYNAEVKHLWYGRQLAGLARALGYYGLCDYVPTNTLFNFHASYSSAQPATNHGGLTRFFMPIDDQPGGDRPFYFVGQGMTNTGTLGIYALTVAQSYGITNPYERTVTDSGLQGELLRYYDTDYPAAAGGGKDALQQFITLTLRMGDLMTSGARPVSWPSVSVGVARYVKSAHYVNLAKVRWMSPFTGETSELSFTGFGTTLRGARMQRKPDAGGGWAAWDNASGTMNDLNLDSP